jgi:phosphate transport system protein
MRPTSAEETRMSSHIVKSYDAELSELDRMTAEMGGLAEALLHDAFQALERRDPGLAEKAAASDRAVDELERRLQDRAIYMIAKRQPMANDLRHIMTVLKIAGDLERIGDLAKNIAKRALAIAGESHPKPLMAGLAHMSGLAARQLKDVLDAFSAADDAKALAVWRADASLDALYNSVFRELLTYMMEDPRTIGLCTHLLFGAKNLERIGDHTTNIAENIHYLVTGGKLIDERAKGDDTSSVLIGARKD